MAILVVDDNAINRRVLQLYLERAGYETIFASSGREALALLASTPTIELLVTDIRMPEMDGWQLIAEVRKSPEWSGIPVIVSSAFADMGSVQRAKELDIKSFVVKPVNAEYLMREIRNALAGSGPCLMAARSIMTRLQLDREEYYALTWDFSAEIERTIRMVERILQSYPVEIAADGEDLPRLRDLHESCRMMGADRAVALLARLVADPENEPGGNLRALLRECRLLHDAVGHRLTELDAEREREVESDLRRRKSREVHDPVVSNTLSDNVLAVRAIATSPQIVGEVLERAGLGALQGITPGESPEKLGLEFAVWVPVALPGKRTWLDVMLAMTPASATALYAAALGDTQAPDDDLREMLRESMNFIQGALKAALEAEFVDYVVPKIPKPVRVSDVQAAASGNERRARWGVALEHGAAHLLIIEHAAEALAKAPEDLAPFDVATKDVPDLAEPGAMIVEAGVMLDDAGIAAVRERAGGALIAVIEPSPFARMLATR